MHRRGHARAVGDRVEDRLAICPARPLGPDLPSDRADPLRREQHEQAARRRRPGDPRPGARGRHAARADRARDGDGARRDDPVVVGDRVLQVVGREQVEGGRRHRDEQPLRREQAEAARRQDEHREDPELGRPESLVDRRQRVPHHELERVRERVAPRRPRTAGRTRSPPRSRRRGARRRPRGPTTPRRRRRAPRRAAVVPSRRARARARRT